VIHIVKEKKEQRKAKNYVRVGWVPHKITLFVRGKKKSSQKRKEGVVPYGVFLCRVIGYIQQRPTK
jgi:hypothetical protein